MESQLRVLLLSKNATLPTRGSAGAAAYDLASAVDIIVPARSKAVVPTDIAIGLPKGTYGRIAGRSGLAAKKHINVAGGVIDPDYNHNLGCILFNHGDEDFVVKIGDRIAQLILELYKVAEVVEVETLDETVRGAGGFGSTGI